VKSGTAKESAGTSGKVLVATGDWHCTGRRRVARKARNSLRWPPRLWLFVTALSTFIARRYVRWPLKPHQQLASVR